jgi:hypothetical protein
MYAQQPVYQSSLNCKQRPFDKVWLMTPAVVLCCWVLGSIGIGIASGAEKTNSKVSIVVVDSGYVYPTVLSVITIESTGSLRHSDGNKVDYPLFKKLLRLATFEDGKKALCIRLLIENEKEMSVSAIGKVLEGITTNVTADSDIVIFLSLRELSAKRSSKDEKR